MKKIVLFVLVLLLLVGCQSEDGYKYSIIRQIAENENVPMTEINISFLESCAVSIKGNQHQEESIFYVQVKGEKEVYEYHSKGCMETRLGDFKVTLFSRDGEIPPGNEGE